MSVDQSSYSFARQLTNKLLGLWNRRTAFSAVGFLDPYFRYCLELQSQSSEWSLHSVQMYFECGGSACKWPASNLSLSLDIRLSSTWLFSDRLWHSQFEVWRWSFNPLFHLVSLFIEIGHLHPFAMQMPIPAPPLVSPKSKSRPAEPVRAFFRIRFAPASAVTRLRMREVLLDQNTNSCDTFYLPLSRTRICNVWNIWFRAHAYAGYSGNLRHLKFLPLKRPYSTIP